MIPLLLFRIASSGMDPVAPTPHLAVLIRAGSHQVSTTATVHTAQLTEETHTVRAR